MIWEKVSVHCCDLSELSNRESYLNLFTLRSVLQNVGSVRQLLYDFPWTNVGKLVFVVSQTHHHTFFFSAHSPEKHFSPAP